MHQNPTLVTRYRDLVAESFHRGVICIVDKDKEVIFSAGNIRQMCYPRSAMKFIQMIQLIETGAFKRFGFTVKELAIMCGSHNGEDEHVDVVRGILSKIGLDENDLRCGPQYPTLGSDRNDMICEKLPPGHIHNNCSGKHSGFLAMAIHLGYDIDSYLSPRHPVQKLILKVAEEMYETPRDQMAIGVDGCSAPIFSVPVYNQAVSFRNLVNPEQFSKERKEACAQLVGAALEYPYMIAGKNRYCTELMQALGDRVLGKTGADGVYSMAFVKEQMGVAIKIDDGLMGPQYAVAQKILEASGLFSDEVLAPLRHYMEEPLLNWNRIQTGRSIVNEEVFLTFKI
ncbi:MAG: asparaginase [Bacteroidota bacterium]|nr:asparaginase [Bacteroidota bacterium]